MEKYFRFEDALPAWREKARLAFPSGAWAEPARVAKACLDWLSAEGCWSDDASDRTRDRVRVEAEVEVALRRLAEPRRGAAAAAGEIAPSAWAIPAAVGSAIGAAVLAPLTGNVFDSKPTGLFLGGALGAFLLIRGMAAALSWPRLANAGPIAFLLPRRAARLGGPADADAGDVSRMIDLALAVCWSHPDRLSPAAAEAPRAEPAELPGQVRAELSRLWGDLSGGASDAGLRDACEELFQRLGEDGYEWKSVPPGTPYDAGMAEAFDAFGLISPGQPVRARRPAMFWRGRAIHKGELRRA